MSMWFYGADARRRRPAWRGDTVVVMTADHDEGLHELVEARLRRADLRYTAGRRALVDLLADAGDPVSIGDIADRLPELPRSSAYRHLVDLQAAGVVRRVAANDNSRASSWPRT